jgi:predicted small metal-binding protein
MTRKYIDCRDMPDSTCSVAISANDTDELVEAAAQHAVKAHRHPDTPDLRKEVRKMVKEGSPRP